MSSSLPQPAADDLAEFEKQLEAVLALDPVERLSTLDRMTEEIRDELKGSSASAP